MDKPPRITWRGGQLPAIKSRDFKYYRYARKSQAELRAVGEARKEIIMFIWVYQNLRALPLTQATKIIHGRITQRKIPGYILDAVLIANARPNQIGSITISLKTLLRWARALRLADGDVQALVPLPTKTLYANTNAKPAETQK